MDNGSFVNMYQVANELISKYDFRQQFIKQYADYLNVELWMCKEEDPNFQLIRITCNNPEEFSKDQNRVKNIIKGFEALYKKELSFLDIHVGEFIYNSEFEPYKYLNVMKDYTNGYDVHDIYPEIYTAIVDYEDADKEMNRLIASIEETNKRRLKEIPFFQRNYTFVTYGTMAICTVIFLICELFKTKYSASSVYVLMGADYMTFTLGLRQFWRLITCAFIHDGILHYATNMYSLYLIGRYMEMRLGQKNYLITFLICLLTGSLTQSILTENTITVGISGAIYGLLIIMIIDLLKLKMVNIRSFIPLIVINLLINLMDKTAWIAHLGGLVAGLVIYFYMNQKDKRGPAILIAAMVLCLFIKYVTIRKIEPIYGGTDMEVVKIINDMGFKDYALKLTQRLMNVYQKYGG
ncbi:MAG: rhomboid family intramembrane serine protease [Erysipelotrichaceae bacterium]|nr:rhomboid family intramembrane serine protease [Erysipelotrichaceae bacterium]